METKLYKSFFFLALFFGFFAMSQLTVCDFYQAKCVPSLFSLGFVAETPLASDFAASFSFVKGAGFLSFPFFLLALYWIVFCEAKRPLTKDEWEKELAKSGGDLFG
jgi:hypothetical protein